MDYDSYSNIGLLERGWSVLNDKNVDIETMRTILKELYSRIEICIVSNLDGQSVLSHYQVFANNMDNALQTIRQECKADGEIMGYLPFGSYKAPRPQGDFFWEE